MNAIGFLFRVLPDGDRWAYRRGQHVVARHHSVDEALDHARRDASANTPSSVILHSTNGDQTVVATFE